MNFPRPDDVSYTVTYRKDLYNDEQNRVDLAGFVNRKLIMKLQPAVPMDTVGGQLDYMHKSKGEITSAPQKPQPCRFALSGVLLSMLAQKTNDGPINAGIDGKVNLYSDPFSKISVDGNLGYSKMIGVPDHLADPVWKAGVDLNLHDTIFVTGSLTFRF